MDSFEIDFFRPKNSTHTLKGVLIVKIGISIHLSNGAEILENSPFEPTLGQFWSFFDLWNSTSYNFTGIIGRIGVGMCRLDLFDTLIRLV